MWGSELNTKKRYNTRGVDRGAQAVARGAARCALQVLHYGSQAAARGGAVRSLSQVPDHGAQASASLCVAGT